MSALLAHIKIGLSDWIWWEPMLWGGRGTMSDFWGDIAIYVNFLYAAKVGSVFSNSHFVYLIGW